MKRLLALATLLLASAENLRAATATPANVPAEIGFAAQTEHD